MLKAILMTKAIFLSFLVASLSGVIFKKVLNTKNEFLILNLIGQQKSQFFLPLHQFHFFR